VAVRSYLVRHAKAGSRERWAGPDEARPLTPSGIRQAEALVDHFHELAVRRIASSAYVRCVQTVEPLARARGHRVEAVQGLAEGAGPEWALDMLSREDGAVLCSHADVIGEVVMTLTERGVPLEGGMQWEKGSTWAFESQGGRIIAGHYMPPPA
jgi:8-oxo-dGTP diphosphatase